MTLTIHDDLIQGSDEWHDARRGMVTASVVGQLITPTLKVADNDTSRGLTRLLVAERITGHTDPTYQSDDMFRGVMEEPRARDHYSEHYAEAVECGFMVRSEPGWTLGYSPDGLVGDDGLLEVKAPRQKEHLRTIISDQITEMYTAQIQAGLLVSGRNWCDYASWCGGLPMYVKRIYPDPAWFDAIERAVRAFEDTAAFYMTAYETATEGLPATERTDFNIVELKL